MIKLFVTERTPRLEYITELIFEQLLNTSFEIYSDIEQFNQQAGIKLNYSSNSNVDGAQITPDTLLSEGGITERAIETGSWNDLPTLFPSNDQFIPFDIFSASFYLVTCYEEYLPGNKDHHGRYRAKDSLAYKHKFLDRPLVNIWVVKLAEAIQKLHSDFQWKKPAYSYQPTIDIDNAFAFKFKGIARNTGSGLRDLKDKNWHAIATRTKVMLRIEKDPYDTYAFISKEMIKNDLKPYFFILLNNAGQYDHSLNPNNIFYHKLIKRLSKRGEIGIHPSYKSNKSKEQLAKEVGKLENILNHSITSSRQHYLKFSIPTTYRKLIHAGIKHEYSMGYAELPGFRASISIPFHFFDLILNKKTELLIHPFMIMDGTFRNYLEIDQEEALIKIEALISQTKAYGGTFISVWHNESLSNRGHWKNWRNLYIEMTKMAIGKHE